MKKLLVLLITLFMCMTNLAFASFSDVPADHWYYDSITWLEENGVVVGYSDGTFKPEQSVNRAEFLKMLYETIGRQGSDIVLPFPDVPEDEWYTKYVKEAYETDVVDGYPDGTFKPANDINVAEALKIVMNGFYDVDYFYGEGSKYEDLSCYGIEADLRVVSDVDSWYWKYVYVADSACIIPVEMVVGHIGLMFDPSDSLTRGEMAEFLYRAKAVHDNSHVVLEKYASGMEPFDIYIEFDGCGTLTEYSDQPWFDDLNSIYEDEFLIPLGISGGVGGDYGEGCLALNGSLFIFIPEFYDFGCGRIFSYDIIDDILQEASGDKYCASEFGLRVGQYVEFIGSQGEGGAGKDYEGRYYYLDGHVEVINSSESSYCTDDPVVTDIGREIYPTYPEYQHLDFLGQLFTAVDCGDDARISDIFGVEGDEWVLGSSVWIVDLPSEELVDVFDEIGYICVDEVDPLNCDYWMLEDTVKIDDLMKLEPYVDELMDDDCINCG